MKRSWVPLEDDEVKRCKRNRCKQPATEGMAFCAPCREDRRLYMQRKRQERAVLGLCMVGCGKPSGGFWYCEEHRKQQNERSVGRLIAKRVSRKCGIAGCDRGVFFRRSRYCWEHGGDSAESAARRAKLGICVRCGAQKGPRTQWLCEGCGIKRAAAEKQRRQEARP